MGGGRLVLHISLFEFSIKAGAYDLGGLLGVFYCVCLLGYVGLWGLIGCVYGGFIGYVLWGMLAYGVLLVMFYVDYVELLCMSLLLECYYYVLLLRCV